MSESGAIGLRASMRLQLHAGFTLDDAAAQTDYYARLGISHLYLSPIARAVPGSTHGYDNIDPTRVNPELGGEPALLRLAAAARRHGMGLIMDIVPNHMAAHAGNAWWMDLLRHGRGSRCAEWFDVDWDAPGADGKVVLPVLDRPLVQALAAGVLVLEDDGHGGWRVRHHDQCWPLAAGAVAPGERPAHWAAQVNAQARRSRGPLRAILERQCYRLLWWRAGNDRINYRRFFDITSLVALRCERAEVFRAVHALPLRLLAQGVIDGVRVDHVDGLADPTAYVQALRWALDRAAAKRGLAPGAALLYVEKILAPGEELPAAWACQGTTGYDFMDQVGGLLHKADGLQALAWHWSQAGQEADFAVLEHQARLEILRGPLQAEFCRCLRRLLAVAHATPAHADLSMQMWARALQALCVHFPVYRTYAVSGGLDGPGARWLEQARQGAEAGLGPAERQALQALVAWLQGGAGLPPGPSASLLRRLRTGFEQLTAPLNAKAVEDTVFYRHGVLLSRNEVGSHPMHRPLDVPGFHRACLARAGTWPRALLATATHDHKRGEDTRARLAVLSERPQWWNGCVDDFEAAIPAEAAQAIPAPFRRMLWQTLVAAWPLDAGLEEPQAGYAERVGQWALKALREGKQYSNWTDPDEALEAAVQDLLGRALDPGAAPDLFAALSKAATAVGVDGARKSLAQTLLRLICPGVPDTYQGTEGWDLSLVDPDNRRPVDYPRRRAWLDDARPWAQLLDDWQDGAVKARLLSSVLGLRRRQPRLFSGRYLPLEAGPEVIAFQRLSGRRALCVVALVGAAPQAGEGLALPVAFGAQQRLHLPAGHWHEVLGGQALDRAQAGEVALSTLLARSPVAVWCNT
jgi:(1->4)-alpha-D-glucan 1-alpha-D-glucosylmutase